MSTQIKICGVRRPEDVQYINEAMPDYVGFIFWEKSFRYVTIEQALRLREQIDSRILSVGVYVDEGPERIIGHVRSGAIQIVQLHGHESEEYIKTLRKSLQTPIWKAFKVRSAADLEKAGACCADKILLDNGYGTGECFDHELIRGFDREYILAGGLRPDNITDVIKKYHPSMVDLSSGVETDKCKDRGKILRAVIAARSMK